MARPAGPSYFQTEMTPWPQALGPSRASRPTTVWVTGLLMGIIVGRLSTSASGGSSSGSSAAASEGTSECAWAICCLDQCPEVKCSSVLPRSAASLERSGVPSPVEAAERFAAANTDGSDKTTYHSYVRSVSRTVRSALLPLGGKSCFLLKIRVVSIRNVKVRFGDSYHQTSLLPFRFP